MYLSQSVSPQWALLPRWGISVCVGLVLDFFVFFFCFLLVGWGGVGGGGEGVLVGVHCISRNEPTEKKRKGTDV